jgi:Protein of unknown function (DUF2971)
MELWQRQLIRYLFPYSSKRMRIELAFMSKEPHIPQFLYKYRSFGSKHRSALEQNVLYMSSPDRLNDPHEAKVYFDPNRFLIEDRSATAYAAALDDPISWPARHVENPIRVSEWRKKIIDELLPGVNPTQQEALGQEIEKFFAQQNAELVRRMNVAFRKGFSILSLSENVLSTLMWSHYGDSHKGFSIEYEFLKLPYGDLRRRLCFPVFYVSKVRDASRYINRADVSDFNNLFGQFLALIKHKEWAYEREWRIIHALGEPYANRPLDMPTPSAIVIGSQVAAENEDWMKAFCKPRGIPLRRIVESRTAFDLSLVNVPLD